MGTVIGAFTASPSVGRSSNLSPSAPW